VSENVEPEEAEALSAVAQEESREESPAAVLQRDFHRPRRFSASSLDAFRRTLALGLSDLDRALRSQFKRPLRTEALAVDEVSADGLFDELGDPFALGSFRVADQPGWIQWDVRSAVQSIELLLGSEGEPEPRPLSGIERHLLHGVFAAVVDTVTTKLGIEAKGLEVVAAAEDIPGWQDSGSGSEAYRLSVAVRLEGIGEGSTFHLYLPGIRPAEDALAGREDVPLPEHLHAIRVELGAYLGSADVPLDDLLALEIGDVIPLGTQLSEPLQLRVEGLACGTAEMGTHRGNRAVRVIEVTPRLDDIA
jgi:flagellar motor switch protein FliM